METESASRPAPAAEHLRLATATFRTPPPSRGFLGDIHTAVIVIEPGRGHDFDPFLLLADDRIDVPERRWLGEPHPHAGLETVTFVLSGTSHDRDEGDLTAGDVLWMNAGRGIIHNEAVQADGRLRILQLWIALPASERNSEPDYQLVRRAEAPVLHGAGFEARLYSGATKGLRAMTRNRAPVTLLDVTLDAHATFRHDMPPDYNGFAYVLDGAAEVGGAPATAGDVVAVGPGPGTDLVLSAMSEPARVVLYTGRPNREPVFVRGPFAAGSGDEISEYARRFKAGQFTRMSELAGQRD